MQKLLGFVLWADYMPTVEVRLVLRKLGQNIQPFKES